MLIVSNLELLHSIFHSSNCTFHCITDMVQGVPRACVQQLKCTMCAFQMIEGSCVLLLKMCVATCVAIATGHAATRGFATSALWQHALAVLIYISLPQSSPLSDFLFGDVRSCGPARLVIVGEQEAAAACGLDLEGRVPASCHASCHASCQGFSLPSIPQSS